jgi:hypothetical protein
VHAVSTAGFTPDTFLLQEHAIFLEKGLAGTPWINLELIELLNELLIADESKADCN